MKITKANWLLLPAALQSAFKQVGDSEEYDNGEESADNLKTALAEEKEARRKTGEKLAAFEAEKAKEIDAARKKALEDARNSGDFKAIEDDYKRQLKELRDEASKREREQQERTLSDAVDKEARELAKMFISPSLALPAIKSRLKAELVEGEAIVRVLTKDGKSSAASVSDLGKEFLTDKELKGSLVASKATGGGTTVATPGAGRTGGDDKPFNAATAKPSELVAHLDAKYGDSAGDDD